MNEPSLLPSLYVLTNRSRTEVKITNFGGIITSIRVPDRFGNLGQVVLGFDDPGEYRRTQNPYFGAVVGRFANRIAEGRFTLDGLQHQVVMNDRGNHLHGGDAGFDKVVWFAEPISDGVEMRYLSPDGEEGYPGNLAAAVTYTLTEANELIVKYRATTDQATVINLSQHSYFNLADGGRSDILRHELFIDADRYTAIDASGIPTGELISVEGTPFDFRKPRSIGSKIDDTDRQLKNGLGYDHNWVLNPRGPQPIVTVYEPLSGRCLEVETTEPGMQFYSGNFLDGTVSGRETYQYRAGLCLEAQHFPDSPNHPSFPTTVLRPGETYSQRTVYRFSVIE
jgi:aldose 1-epimerase